MKQWYAFYTKPNAEYRVESSLQEQDIQTYLPELRTSKATKRENSKPFFPCYLFARVDFEAVGLSSLQWTPGLRRIVTVEDRPVPVDEAVIALIKSKLGDRRAMIRQAEYPFEPGDTVRITDGPFCDMEAVFEGSATADDRVQVLLNILGRFSRTHVDVTDLKKLLQESLNRPKSGSVGRGAVVVESNIMNGSVNDSNRFLIFLVRCTHEVLLT